MAATLPIPRLSEQEGAGVFFLTDDALAQAVGVRIAFSGRAGGVSEGAYSSLNVGGHVGDAAQAVQENRRRLAEALGAAGLPLVVPKQVHGTALVDVRAADAPAVEAAQRAAGEGADGIVVSAPGVAALLCFADCVPVVVVSPTGRFAVVHAGWRGAVAHIAAKAVRALAALDVQAGGDGEGAAGAAWSADALLREAGGSEADGGSSGSGAVGAPGAEGMPAGASAASAAWPADALLREAASAFNVYIGPCIHAECFACGPDVCAQFERAFGGEAVPEAGRVDLPRAVALDVEAAGVDARRVCDAGACTACDAGRWFSYQASGGVCGRHGALAFRRTE